MQILGKFILLHLRLLENSLIIHSKQIDIAADYEHAFLKILQYILESTIIGHSKRVEPFQLLEELNPWTEFASCLIHLAFFYLFLVLCS